MLVSHNNKTIEKRFKSNKNMEEKLKILENPNKILRQKSSNISEKTIKSSEFQKLLPKMEQIMIKKDGIGLAAPQIGKNIRLVIIKNEDDVFIMINPVITKRSWAQEWGEEGCLSVPHTFGRVRRHKKIRCTYYDKDNKKQTIEAQDLFARVIQHEIDHLDGILFIDKAKDIKEV